MRNFMKKSSLALLLAVLVLLTGIMVGMAVTASAEGTLTVQAQDGTELFTMADTVNYSAWGTLEGNVVKVNEATGFLYSINDGASWTYSATLANNANGDGIHAATTHMEAVGDYVLDAVVKGAYKQDVIIDFNGFTFTRSVKDVFISFQGTGNLQNSEYAVFKNATFDGKIGGEAFTDGMAFIMAITDAHLTFENCTFVDVDMSGNANVAMGGWAAQYSTRGAVTLNGGSSITLIDTTFTRCTSNNGAVFVGGNCTMTVSGNTVVASDDNTVYVGAYAQGASLGVGGTFTGKLYWQTNGAGPNGPATYVAGAYTPTEDDLARTAVAAGAKVQGLIAPFAGGAPVANMFAYDNNGYLVWGKVGNALAAAPDAAYDEETNTLDAKAWYYNDGTADVATTVGVAGVYDYFLKNVDAEAVINGDTVKYGTLKEMYNAAAAGDTIEILKDIDGIQNFVVAKAVTFDGNGHTLTWRQKQAGDAEGSTTDGYMFMTNTSGVVYKNIVFHGGATEKGVWTGTLVRENTQMLPHNAAFTLEDCVITGVRVETTAMDRGVLFGYEGTSILFKNVQIYDNIMRISDQTASSNGKWARQASNSAVHTWEGQIIFRENYKIMSDGTVYAENYRPASNVRMALNQLTEGSELRFNSATSVPVATDAAGNPYDNSGYLYVDTTTEGYVKATTVGDKTTITGVEGYQSALTKGAATTVNGVSCYLFTQSEPAPVYDDVTLTVKNASNEVILTYTASLQQNKALPTFATWTNVGGTPVALHTAGNTAYTGVVAVDTGFLVCTSGAWSYQADIVPAGTTAGGDNYYMIPKTITKMIALGDYTMNYPVKSDWGVTLEIDFGGYTVTRSAANVQFFFRAGTNNTASNTVNVTIRNANFDGKVNGAASNLGVTFINAYDYATVTIENSSFTDCDSSGITSGAYPTKRGGALSAYTSKTTGSVKLVLNDVIFTNCTSSHGAVALNNYATLHVGGNTYIAGDMYVGGYAQGVSLGISKTFTGEIFFNTNGATKDVPTTYTAGAYTPTEDDIARASVAEGAEVKGRIASYTGGAATTTFAYNKNGTLTWIRPNDALDTTGLTPVSYDKTANTLSGDSWFYNDGTKNVATAAAVAGYYYYFKAPVSEVGVEAVIDRTGNVQYGTLVEMINKASANETIEILADISGIENLTIAKAITLDGNGHTLTWYQKQEGDEDGAEDGSTYFMIKAAAAGLTFKDIIFHGGATEAGVWTGALTRANASMLPHSAAVTYDGCTITGARIETLSKDRGMIFGYEASAITFIDTEIYDNIMKTTDASGYSKGYWFRQGNANAIHTWSGKIVFKDNYLLGSDDTLFAMNYYLMGAGDRCIIGELSEGSEFHIFQNTLAFSATTGADGKIYNNSGYFWGDNSSSTITKTVDPETGAITVGETSCWPAHYVLGDLRADGRYNITLVKNAAADTSTVNAQGGITTDKFDLYYMTTITGADYYATEVVISVNGKEVSRKSLSTYNMSAANVYDLTVTIGMAQLTDDIKIEIYDGVNKKSLGTFSSTAKQYLDAVIASGHATSKAAASLMQYGAKVQEVFSLGLDRLAMTDENLAAWKEAGLVNDVADSAINVDNATVAAVLNGTCPDGLTINGIAFSLGNETALRVYFSFDGDDYAYDGILPVGKFKVITGIGTADLATAQTFTFGEYTVEVSPMTYVYNVIKSGTTGALADACEAFYYYYAAVAECFSSVVTDTTGFSVLGLNAAADEPNAYSAPNGI